jgi:hypothetical protein
VGGAVEAEEGRETALHVEDGAGVEVQVKVSVPSIVSLISGSKFVSLVELHKLSIDIVDQKPRWRSRNIGIRE